jgi:shikimate dehydrogenase
MHNAAFAACGIDGVYVPFEVAPGDIGAALAGVRALGMYGVNVTVPLKELVAPHVDELSERVRVVGSVNTVVRRADGSLYGDSTDGPGFLAAVAAEGVTVGPGTRVVVLGAGGSARAVVYALAEAGAAVVVANRSVERAAALAAEFAGLPGRIAAAPLTEAAVGAALEDAAVLVNTTSVGMHPDHGAMPPVPADALTPTLFVSDLIYNPAETRLLALARSRGCRVQNGVEMLVRQGALSFAQWTGVAEPPVDAMRAAVLAALAGRR